jgi:hypothetical protein
MDMNENNPDQGVSIETLLQIIGLRDVELYVHEQGVKKLQEQALSAARELAVLKAKPTPIVMPPVPSITPELEQLRKADIASGERVKQLEKQVHDVALERDAMEAEKHKAFEETARLERLTDDLQAQLLKAQEAAVPAPAEKKTKKK